jgi:hypothetical protein
VFTRELGDTRVRMVAPAQPPPRRHLDELQIGIAFAKVLAKSAEHSVAVVKRSPDQAELFAVQAIEGRCSESLFSLPAASRASPIGLTTSKSGFIVRSSFLAHRYLQTLLLI